MNELEAFKEKFLECIKDSKNKFLEWIKDPKNKKYFFICVLAIAVITIALVILISKNGRLTKDEMLDYLPDSVFSVRVDDEWLECEVESFKIKQRKTEKERDEVYSEIVLVTDSLKFTTYRKLDFIEYNDKYNKNVWLFSDYSTYQDTKVEIVKAPNELYTRALKQIERYDGRYENIENAIKNDSVSIKERQISYTFNIDKSIGMLEVSGTIRCNYSLRGSLDSGYFWDCEFDDGGIQKKWNVTGNWYGYCTNFGTGMYELMLDIDSLINDDIVLNWTWNYDGKVYSGDQTHCRITESNEELIEITIKYDKTDTSLIGSYVTVTLYADGNSFAEKTFLGSWLMNRQ